MANFRSHSSEKDVCLGAVRCGLGAGSHELQGILHLFGGSVGEAFVGTVWAVGILRMYVFETRQQRKKPLKDSVVRLQ